MAPSTYPRLGATEVARGSRTEFPVGPRDEPEGNRFSTLVRLLRARTDADPERRLYRFLERGECERESLTRGELDIRARALAARLQAEGMAGERALLLLPSGPEFVVAFFACLYAGVIAVPAYPPSGRRRSTRLDVILGDASPRVSLAPRRTIERPGFPVKDESDGGSVRVVATDEVDPAGADDWGDPGSSADGIAFLQYTSGSTSNPKGVEVTHGNLMHNQALIRDLFGMSPRSVVVSWLPMYHDMGLIGMLLQPLFSGGEAVLMPPMAFLQKPERWLRAITTYGADTSGAPDFAYDLCTRRIDDSVLPELDLSGWRLAFDGAEPVRAGTLERFARRFEPCGFRRSAFFPCYGLAENTLLVTGRGDRELCILDASARKLERGRAAEAVDDDPADTSRPIVSCGAAPDGVEVAIVDPDTHERLGPSRVGEIWVSGSSVARGYWKRLEATAETFCAHLADGTGPYLRTGDLGFLRPPELFVVGRLKDLVIIRGRNHHPHDLELTAERSHPALRSGCGAAFSVEAESGEGLVLVYERNRSAEAELDEILASVRESIADEHEIRVQELVLVRRGSIPKTTSGKIQRARCRRQYLEAELTVEARSGRRTEEGAVPEASTGTEAVPRSPLELLIADRASTLLDVPAESVHPEASLAALGLDSVSAFELSHRLEEATGKLCPVPPLLGGITVGELAKLLGEADENDAATESARDLGATGEAPLSWGQRALWLEQQRRPESAAYHLVGGARLDGELDSAALAAALTALVDRHPAWRVALDVSDGEPVQRIGETGRPSVEWIETDALDDDGLHGEMTAEARRPFRPGDRLLRIRVYTRSGAPRALVLVVHHAVADLWSLALAARELRDLYGRALAGEEAPLTEPRPTASYLGLLREPGRRPGEGDELEDDAAWRYWSRLLEPPLPVLDLPLDRPRPARGTDAGETVRRDLAPGLEPRLEERARREGVTPFVHLLAVYFTLLHRLSGQHDLVVGFPAVDRTSAERARVLGYFVNPLAVRLRIDDDATSGGVVSEVGRQVKAALEHVSYPFGLLVDRLDVPREDGRPPVFQTLFSYQDLPSWAPPGLAAWAVRPAAASVELGAATLRGIEIDSGSSRFELSLTVGATEHGLSAACEFGTDVFDRTSALRVLRWLEGLLEQTTAVALDTPLAELSLLTEAERHQMIAEWNDTGRSPGAAGPTVVERIARVARLHPDTVATAWEGRSLTYAGLRSRAQAVASLLRDRGVGSGDRVAVCLRRSERLAAVLLGVLKARAAYVPLDPELPEERLRLMVEDSGASVLVTESGLDRDLSFLVSGPSGSVEWVEVDTAWASPVAMDGDPAPPPPGDIPGDALAYVIYTSGSTGRPKGVAVTHGSLTNFLAAMAHELGLERAARPDRSEREATFICLTTLSFDIAMLEVFLPLTLGRRTVVVPEEVAVDGAALGRALERERATVIQATPATWKLLVADRWQGDPSLTLVSGGEALGHDLASRLADRGGRVWNVYGPTETTIWSTARPVRHAGSRSDSVSIGRPIDNTAVHVLDRTLRPPPLGAAGELLIGGDGLARGYLGRPDLTAESFVPDPFSSRPGRRFYRTGDLVRYRRDGALSFLGRLDHQLKVRGHRVEPSEIQVALRTHPGVRDAVVVGIEEQGGETALAAYVVAPDGAPTHQELRDHLRGTLPGSMVPSYFEPVEELPLTPSGKIDRKRLPAPERRAGDGYGEAPRSPLEDVVRGIWHEVLGVGSGGSAPAIGRDADFFDLGGHSLHAARVLSRVREALGVSVPLRAFFENPSLAGLAGVIGRERSDGAGRSEPPVEPTADPADAPLSFAQERLWFFEQLEPLNPAYLMPAALRLEGELDRGVLAAALGDVVERHSVLRSAVVSRDGTPRSELRRTGPMPLPVADLSGLPAKRAGAEGARLIRRAARRPFRLDEAPLVRWLLVQSAAESAALVICAHHLTADGGSVEIFFRELSELYRARDEEQTPELPELPVQYRDVAAWQRDRAEAGAFDRACRDWSAELEDAEPLDLPTDRPRPPARRFRGDRIARDLAPAVAQALRRVCRDLTVTPFMALLAIFAASLARAAGRREAVLGTPFTSRTRPELEGLVGMFVNTVPLRLAVDESTCLTDLSRSARREVLGAFERRGVPFERVLETRGGARELDRDPLFQATFAEENAPSVPDVGAAGATIEPVYLGTSKFDLSLFADTSGETLSIAFEYDVDLFDRTTVERMLRQMELLVNGASRAPNRSLRDLEILAPAERHQIVTEWGRGEPADEPGVAVHVAVAEQARERPDGVAVTSGAEHLSYGELHRRAARLARELREWSRPGEPVPVLMNRSPSLVVTLLGVLLAGRAYVPLDPASPRRRVLRMLELLDARRVLTEVAEASRVEGFPGGIELLDAPVPSGGAAGPTDEPPLPTEVLPGDWPAYAIFTSGSTGEPKAVLIPHRGLSNLVAWHIRTFGLGPATATTQLAGLGFDASVWELWPPLAAGATVHQVAHEVAMSPPDLVSTLDARRVTQAFLPTPLAEAVLAEPAAPAALDVLLTGGDRLRGWPAGDTGYELWNHYGPTEGTVVTSYARIDPREAGDVRELPPIGRPIRATRVHVIDRLGRPAPPGSAGELYVGGAGLAMGYIAQPGKTSAAFVPDPWGPSGSRLYRTGDMVRFDARGDLEFLGRFDHQVKVRGYRIELGEIEAVLRRHPEISDAAVLATGPEDDGAGADRSLAAYFAARDEVEIPELRRWLAEELPARMVPASFVAMDALPLTASGKVDRRRLQAMQAVERSTVMQEFVAPRSSVEALIAGIWADLLGVGSVGVHDDFFELGGHSLQIAKMISAVRDELAVELPLRAVFENPTVAGLAVQVARALVAQADQDELHEALLEVEAM